MEFDYKEEIERLLRENHNITVDNGKLAIYLSDDKENLENLTRNDNEAEVMIFKQANALGWKTFRRISDESDMTEDEVLCVHTSKGVQCRDCGLCNGRVCNIANPEH